MTASADWYRNTVWTPAIAEAFEKRLSRSRSQRGEYLRIQALSLAESNTPEYAIVAISLARRHLDLEPQSIFAAQMHAAIGKAFETLGEISSAIDAYRAAVKLEHQRPNVRGYHYIDFAWFVVVNELVANCEEALVAIDQNKHEQDLIFPANQYRYFGSLALVSAILGDRETAKRMARNALESTTKENEPFWRFPLLGLIKGKKDAIRARLNQLAS